jgi:hypothetical protein
MPFENADWIFRNLHGDAAGGADGHDLRGLFIHKKQVGGAVRAGGHIPGRNRHGEISLTIGREWQA